MKRAAAAQAGARSQAHSNLTRTPPQHDRLILSHWVCTAASIILCGSAHADPAAWEGTFALKCAGCHAGGGNVVQAGATLFPKDLERNGVATPDAMYKLIYGGKGKMPGFGQDCAPRGQCTFGPRLSDEDVQGLTDFVLERAAAGWK